MSQVQADFPVLIEPSPRHPDNPIRVLMVAVIAKLMFDKQQDQNTDGHAHRQTENIDTHIKRLLFGVSGDDFKIVADHHIKVRYEMEYTILMVENEKFGLFYDTYLGQFYTIDKWRLALKNEGLIRKINLQADTAVRWRAKTLPV